jgi:putative transposase
MKASRFREEQIIAVSHEHEAGAKTAEVGRRHGISDATFYIYGRLPRIKRFGFCSDENRLQTSIRRHHLTARPNGKSSHSPGTIGWQNRNRRASAAQRHHQIVAIDQLNLEQMLSAVLPDDRRRRSPPNRPWRDQNDQHGSKPSGLTVVFSPRVNRMVMKSIATLFVAAPYYRSLGR